MLIEELSKRYTTKEIDSLSHRDLYYLWMRAKRHFSSSDYDFDQFNERCNSIFAEDGKAMIDLLWQWGGSHRYASDNFDVNMNQKIQLVINSVRDPALVFIMIARQANGTIIIPVCKVAPSVKQIGFYGDTRLSERCTYWPIVRSAIRGYLINEKRT